MRRIRPCEHHLIRAALAALLFLKPAGARALFLVPRPSGRSSPPRRASSSSRSRIPEPAAAITTLFYKDLPQEDQPAAADIPGGIRQPRQHLSIPVLGPFLQTPPILPVCEERTIIAPTPYQLQILEECVLRHRRNLKEGDNNTGALVAGVSAAPLVAVLDSHTATAGLDRGRRYATLAAVVGAVVQQQQQQQQRGGGARRGTTVIDAVDDNESFMEWLSAPGETLRGVRLMGVGRAVLSDFHYEVPLSVQRDRVDEEGNLRLDPSRTHQARAALLREECIVSDDDDDGQDDDECFDRIVMARFRLHADAVGRSSQAHSLSAISGWVSRIHQLHEDRKRLVARLRRQVRRAAAEKLEDHDGLGDLFASRRRREVEAEGEVASSGADHNFGLGTTAASVSTLASVTATVQRRLRPYHSPARHASEELYYELYSFCAVQALSEFVGPAHVAWAVRCSSTVERLRAVQEWMRSHVEWLQRRLEEEEEEGEVGS